MNPFEAPESDVDALRDLDVRKALSDGVLAGGRNVLGYLAFYFCMTPLSVLGCCTLVGWVAVFPCIWAGFYAFTLETVDERRASLATLFSGFGRIGQILLPMWGLILLLGVANLPSFAMSMAASLSAPFLFDDPISQTIVPSAVAALASTIWLCVIARLLLAPFYLVERGLGPVASITAALDDSQGSWLGLAMLLALIQLVALPALGAFAYVQVLAAAIPPNAPPEALLSQLGVIYFWYGVGALYTMVAGIFTFGMIASAYRQLSGDKPATPVAAGAQ